jgi:hypothetical protein
MPYRRPKAPKTGPGRRRVEATPVQLAGSKCAARANRASVFGAMAQYDDRICTEFLGTACCKRYDASMPYRSAGGVEIADYVIRSR